MADTEKEVQIVIRGKNLTEAQFAAARKGLAGLGDAVDRVNQKTRRGGQDLGVFGQSWKQLTASFTAANLITGAVQGVIGMGQAAIASAGHLVDLSNQTGASIDFLQRASYVAKQTGSDVTDFTKALFALGTNIAKGSASTRQAIAEIGLEYDKLRRQRPEEQWNAVVAALNRIPQPQERNRLALELYGKSVANVLPSIAEGYDRLAADAPRSSDAQIRALDAAADAWDRLKARAENTVVGMLGSLALVAEREGVLKTTLGMLWSPTMVAGLAAQATVEKELERVQQERAKALKDDLAPATQTYAERLAAARSALVSLTPETKKQIQAGLALDQSTKDIAADLQVGEEVVTLYKEALQKTTDAHRKSTQAAEEHRKKLEDLHKELGGAAAITAATDLLGLLAKLPPVHRLTRESQEQVNQTLSEAIDAYRALGEQAPASVRAVFEETWRLTKGQDALKAATRDAAEAVNALMAQHWAIFERQSVQAQARLQEGFQTRQRIASDYFAAIATQEEQALQRAETYRAAELAALAKMTELGSAEYFELAGEVETVYRSMVAAARMSAEAQVSAFRQVLGQLPTVLVTALARGRGQVGAAVGDYFSGVLIGDADNPGPLANQLQSGLGSLLRRTSSGGMLEGLLQGASNAVPFLGPLISKGISAAVAGITKLFGNATKGGRGDFATGLGFGSLAALYDDLRSLGSQGAQLAHIGLNVVGRNDEAANRKWMADVEAFYRNIEGGADKAARAAAEAARIQREALSAQAEAQEFLTATIQKYGFTIDELGPKWRAQRLREEAELLLREWTAVSAAQIDSEAIARRMGSAASTFLQTIRRTGGEVDISMKPMLESLLRFGTLVDENGNKIESLEGIRFSETFSQGVDRMIAKLDELIRKITGDLGQAIGDLPGFTGFLPGESSARPRKPGRDQFLGAAVGGLFDGPQLLYVEPGRKEIVGDEYFMTRALGRAIAESGLSGGVGGTVNVNLNVTIQTLDPESVPRDVADKIGYRVVELIGLNSRGLRTQTQLNLGIPVH